jgi:Cu/Ag efflux protein CusF
MTQQSITIAEWNVVREYAMTAISIAEALREAAAEQDPHSADVAKFDAKLDEAMRVIRKIDNGARQLVLETVS